MKLVDLSAQESFTFPFNGRWVWAKVL